MVLPIGAHSQESMDYQGGATGLGFEGAPSGEAAFRNGMPERHMEGVGVTRAHMEGLMAGAETQGSLSGMPTLRCMLPVPACLYLHADDYCRPMLHAACSGTPLHVPACSHAPACFHAQVAAVPQ